MYYAIALRTLYYYLILKPIKFIIMLDLKIGDIVMSPKNSYTDGSAHISRGKDYKVLSVGDTHFTIKDNEGESIICMKQNCHWLMGSNWILKSIPTKTTLYQKWVNREIGNFGSFQTTILQAYQIADSNNREKLEQAFPEWFILIY